MSVTPQTLDQLQKIKEVREKTGLGLKGAKICLIETNWDVKNAVKYMVKHPELGIPILTNQQSVEKEC